MKRQIYPLIHSVYKQASEWCFQTVLKTALTLTNGVYKQSSKWRSKTGLYNKCELYRVIFMLRII